MNWVTKLIDKYKKIFDGYIDWINKCSEIENRKCCHRPETTVDPTKPPQSPSCVPEKDNTIHIKIGKDHE